MKTWDLNKSEEIEQPKEMKKPYYKQEIYTDEYKSLEQSIIFKIGDYRAASYLRSEINPNLTILKDEIYLDENMKIIKEN